MPTYDMVCENCNFSFEIQQSMSDPLPVRCPQCKKHKLRQNYSAPHCFVYQDPKTVGHLAERNTDKMGKYALEAARNKNPKSKPKPSSWYNADAKNLTRELATLDTDQKKQDYIMKGKL